MFVDELEASFQIPACLTKTTFTYICILEPSLALQDSFLSWRTVSP